MRPMQLIKATIRDNLHTSYHSKGVNQYKSIYKSCTNKHLFVRSVNNQLYIPIGRSTADHGSMAQPTQCVPAAILENSEVDEVEL